MKLTDQQLWEFDTQGFVNVQGLFKPDLIESMYEAALPYRKEHYTQTNDLIEKHPAFYDGMFHQAIDTISCQFFGEYRIKGHVLVINPAQTGGKVGMKLPIWHRDADHGKHPYYATASPSPLFQLRFFIALSDIDTPEHGGLALYPGSHRTQQKWPFDPRSVPSCITQSITQPYPTHLTAIASKCNISHRQIGYAVKMPNASHPNL